MPKVSIVSPCYNKAPYIGNFLDSVLGQRLDDIEVILVNDGSTDGTREAISRWEPKLKARGYSVKIIDQENLGVSEAVRTGLGHVTGDYVCFPDCDDVLDPEYAAAMAAVLDERPDLGRVVCDYDRSGWFKDNKKGLSRSYCPGLQEYSFDLLSSFLLSRTCSGMCFNMIRFASVPMLSDALSLSIKMSQLPAVAALSRLKTAHLTRTLYKYTYMTETSMVKRIQESYETQKSYLSDFDAAVGRILRGMSLPESELEKYMALSKLSILFSLLTQYPSHAEESSIRSQAEELIFGKLKLGFKNSVQSLWSTDPHVLQRAVSNCFIGHENPCVRSDIVLNPGGRIIGYGACGKAAGYLLPDLVKTPLRPGLLWDAAASQSGLFGIPLSKPDISSLRPEDTVLVFVNMAGIAGEIYDMLADSQAENVLYHHDILDYLSDYYYGV